MPIEAAYIVRDYVKGLLELISTKTVDFFPGPFSAPKNQTFPWCNYRVVQNLDYEQPYISTDAMQIEINHTGYDELQRMISSVLRELNRENPHDNNALYNVAMLEKIKLHDVIARSHKVLPNDFIEGTDYFTATVDILMQYVKLPTTDGGFKSAYIGGT